ncbi:O-methyltransferase involved in polyketide biosynthesis [Amycolatopsis bartoniae]|uniref:S-adenosyl methyltransferase n=1 Tax=Amycolatopsis bartoniae TaxID=941986 RepID=A0A8H9J107_9PSEU|nr:SAM-dependent methyltransferase [Amycolatopsis bartoniae]MBB2933793.1 O-methyltransferase involved in polyketide biosynthesis [Amycolatopsis bartoniae]TVT10548.1 hypothetical protein FNH07_04770 [Amycolatopsis bartoniae]GHF71683.1 hypothetical protein GCM10017566_51700 [Amycolatopsis bartoniae]
MGDTGEAAPAAPAGVDVEKPSAARIYDWYLGGDQNWAVDREFGKRALELFPVAGELARQNRAFLGRLVRAAVEAGIRQFLDLGSGVPTVGNVHEIVRDHLPEGERASVVYVDYEPVATAHATVLLEQEEATDWAAMIQADLRNVDGVLTHPETERLIDFGQPVCLLMVAVLHFIGDDDRPADLVARYRDQLVPGSWLAISHSTSDHLDTDEAAPIRDAVQSYRKTSNPMWPRKSAEIESWFGGWPLLDPGLVPPADWRPTEPVSPPTARTRPFGVAGVARGPE